MRPKNLPRHRGECLKAKWRPEEGRGERRYDRTKAKVPKGRKNWIRGRRRKKKSAVLWKHFSVFPHGQHLSRYPRKMYLPYTEWETSAIAEGLTTNRFWQWYRNKTFRSFRSAGYFLIVPRLKMSFSIIPLFFFGVIKTQCALTLQSLAGGKLLFWTLSSYEKYIINIC